MLWINQMNNLQLLNVLKSLENIFHSIQVIDYKHNKFNLVQIIIQELLI